ncbi:hypothetical protein F5Y15DRAFT_371281 [Xylariaceae sp. FL0016]|nr:hypothetical protein F5Y15DRAFT_371281 [Xylariaceae sp. FL0016]
MADEPQINFAIDPYGRRGQIQRHFWYFEDETKKLQAELVNKLSTLKSLEEENSHQVHDAAHVAYDSLVAVVGALLTVDRGDKRIARADATIVEKLDKVVANFQKLHDTSKENAWELGVGATACMTLGDTATRFVDDLEGRMRNLNAQIPGVWSIKCERDDEWKSARDAERDRRRGLDNARSSRDDGGNKFLGFFDSSVITRLDNDVRNAENRLNENLDHQRQARDKMETYYQLAVFHHNASAAIAGLRDKVKTTASDFDVEFKRVTDAQRVEDHLWSGLLDLRNKVLSSDFKSTRDNSLRVILDLLKTDDDIKLGHDCLDTAEARIKEDICGRLGGNAVQLLTAPYQGSAEDFVTSL